MSNNLPYQLSTGVTATEAGLLFDEEHAPMLELLAMSWPGSKSDMLNTTVPWPIVAEQCRYREGEAWCRGSDGVHLICYPSGYSAYGSDKICLHRLAAILVDDAEGFEILHACIQGYL